MALQEGPVSVVIHEQPVNDFDSNGPITGELGGVFWGPKGRCLSNCTEF